MLSPRALVLMMILLSIHTLSEAQNLLWSDEFRDSSGPDPAIWSYDVGGGGWGNGELQVYSQDNVRVEDGKLVISGDGGRGKSLEWKNLLLWAHSIQRKTRISIWNGGSQD